MRPEIYSFSLSGAIIRENFRRYWGLPVLAFVVYFMTGIFTIMIQNIGSTTSPDEINSSAAFIDNLLSGRYPVYSVVTAAVPLISTVFLFRYLHDSRQSVSVHSGPFTRDVLINSHFITVILFCVIPIGATGLILISMSHPVYYAESYYQNSGDMVNLFTDQKVIKWVFESCLCAIFVAVISLFSGMITGTSAHHAIASLAFNAVFPVIVFFQALYTDAFLFGSPGTEDGEPELFSPVTYLYVSDGMSAKSVLIYILVIAAIYVFSMFLYRIKPLEKAGNGIVFKVFDYIITFLAGYIGMSAMGFAIDNVRHSAALDAVGFAAGAVIGVIVCRIFVRKTPRVFQVQIFRYLVPYACFACVFFVIIATGGLGYESRIPSDVHMCTFSVTPSVAAAGTASFDSEVMEDGDRQPISFTDSRSIDAIKDLNSEIVRNKRLCIKAQKEEDSTSDDSKNDNAMKDDMATVKIGYFKDGEGTEKIMTRSYQLPEYMIMSSRAAEAVFESEGYTQNLRKTAQKVYDEDVLQVNVYGSRNLTYMNDPHSLPQGTDISGLTDALIEDMGNMSYREYCSGYKKDPVAVITVKQIKVGSSDSENTEKKKTDEESPEDKSGRDTLSSSGDTEEMYFVVRPECTETIAWLEEHGCGGLMQNYGSQYRAAVVYKTDGKKNFPDTYGYSHTGSTVLSDLEKYRSRAKTAVVTDVYAIRHDYEKSCNHSVYGSVDSLSTEEDDLYYIEFYRINEDGTYSSDYTAYIKGSDLETGGQSYAG